MAVGAAARPAALAAAVAALAGLAALAAVVVSLQRQVAALSAQVEQLRALQAPPAAAAAAAAAAVADAVAPVAEATPSPPLRFLEAAESLKLLGAESTPRRLGVYGYTAAYDSVTTTAGCAAIAATGTLTVSGKNCNTKACPQCFIFTGSTASVTLTLAGCSTAYVGQTYQLGDSGIYTNVAAEYTFINLNTNSISVTDGATSATTKTVATNTVSKGYCLTTGAGGTAGKLIWDAIAT